MFFHRIKIPKDGTKKPVYRLLSSSLDKTLIVWEPEGGSAQGAWTERVRVGEVGGSGLGFYGSRFGPRGGAILGHGYNGSFHIWELDKETAQWAPRVVAGGHYGRVEDAAWAPGAAHLVSVAADQTTRLHAPWHRPDGSTEWHELARPQVHGYDMAAVALVSARVLASAAEEKVVRVFAAPANFDANYANIVGAPLPGRSEGAEGASVPSLGLSNKAVFADEDDNDGYFVPVNLTEPPTEETLMQHTLWPEQQKLYGHGYEVFALAAAPDGSLLASACKATTREHAAILLWETSTWHQIQKLPCHQLTITQLAFSPDSRHLLSVSRDRSWYLHTRSGDQFQLAANTDKTNGVHTRIIWCCAWASDSGVFGTGSREGKVCIWSKAEPSSSSLGDYALLGTPLELPKDSVTALAFAPLTDSVVAVGLDSGRIGFYSFDVQRWTLLKELDYSAAHHMTVRRLSFKPKDEDREMLLASAGADHLVRIYSVYIS
ncbi:hypothetical protein MSG28_003708 [Choristoneura fumiferana]|uniref:Uncharacterized protein n=1 Tax=Choristoneura fumiferana TaxID=7141 RepID=A0ACC0KGP2_CHOFU|nr:hypothetical protein MSG28_003708 [Choristoneura fumiferana]